jgi:hypothetical protein
MCPFVCSLMWKAREWQPARSTGYREPWRGMPWDLHRGVKFVSTKSNSIKFSCALTVPLNSQQQRHEAERGRAHFRLGGEAPIPDSGLN